MARYSPIAPLTLLEQLHEKEILGNYLLLLAHDVLEYPRGYIDLMDHIGVMEDFYPEERFIIMDNSVVELYQPLPPGKVIEAANLVEANCIMIPDVLGDFQLTQKLVMEHASLLRNCGFPLMKVPQGSNAAELVQCVDWLRDYLEVPNGDVDYWGIPRWIANQEGSRIPIIQYINAKCEDPKMHLLGMSAYLSDDLRCTKLPGVMGIDSANPLVMGFARVDLSTTSAYVHMHRGNYWQRTHPDGPVIRNVEHMHELVS
ncbi:hypothetical protein LCGC14_0481290 [marine sediment metagenome]|uniref:Uroporphyrinogen decarboxylase (URO-D) domain-containing protein n=1 Tax=marine sediment metagenome TaxID=412755 RepID=A0A0F9SEF9_9ZZZZ